MLINTAQPLRLLRTSKRQRASLATIQCTSTRWRRFLRTDTKRKLLQKNITEASVLSAQTRNSDMRGQAWENMLVKQGIDDKSNLHYFNLGATGAAFHFDVDALVKYAGRNHNLITPEQAALVRRGYVFASVKPK